MESRAKLFGHAVHPMLIVFPLGLLATALIFDVIYLLTRNGELVIFSYWAIAAGVIGGLASALFGFWDWAYIPNNTRAKTIGLWHGAGNVLIVVLFIVAWLMRRGAVGPEYRPDGIPFILELIGVVLALVTAWLGGELVERLGIGVDSGANPDAPSSLSGRPVREVQR
ncbi:MAG TPA: DUF2231 domain-containing protein [Chloroflexota bacterium]|jgi:uncharacterized membrane protein|nr:DUF2231 domain-containing protein [Chloroflexota bacterium]